MDTDSHTRTVARRGAALLLASVAAWAGLAACSRSSPVTLPEAAPIAWPPPPDPPRVEYLGSFREPVDLGIQAGWLRRTIRRLVRGPVTLSMARPMAVASAPDGTIAVADVDARCVHVFDSARNRYHRIRRTREGMLASPVGVAFDGTGSLLVSDSAQGAVYRFETSGKPRGTLSVDLSRPTGLAFDPDRGVLYVVDTAAHRVLGIDEADRTVFQAGGRGTGPGEFNFPVGVATDRTGRVWVTDTLNFRVQLFDPSGGFVRTFGRRGRGPGDFDKVKGIAIDPDGHVWVVEGLHDVINVYDERGALLTVLGSTGNGPGEFLLPAGIHIDRDGRVLVADSINGRVQSLRYLAEGTGARAAP